MCVQAWEVATNGALEPPPVDMSSVVFLSCESGWLKKAIILVVGLSTGVGSLQVGSCHEFNGSS